MTHSHHVAARTARQLGAGLRALIALTVLCGVLYPLAVTGIAQAAFPGRANGSQLTDAGGRVVGSELIGQRFDLPKKNPDDPEETPVPDLRWFQPRPSAGLTTHGADPRYALLVSGATHLSGDNEVLLRAVRDAKAAVIEDNTAAGYRPTAADVPAEAVTSSGSGLDPHIPPAYAALQVHRVAERNHLAVAEVRALVEAHTDGRILGFVGEPTVNVLWLNVALKALLGTR
ncbi:potassium-transporting ATPase subunit C [Streptomyces candidus]|uniref:Potassium-transporting ATPase KdpC subunit n=1 Tax=Streptomyces candidus TaxID=67283 RepID=A0A7X0LR92_9ACTN|nr:potassium-transporting ATPase subunit C [Streptomyces candidus]MBB6437895.1 K+-transporting ATPase ATPase C chain [Streptomyces candidus]GHH49829.1 potassium-transporting ATPase KdpC subunit [Streptomyces candidus]